MDVQQRVSEPLAVGAVAGSDRKLAHRFLSSLRVGDVVTLVRDGRESRVTVQREIRAMDGGGFGSWDHSAVTVGYGPGRWNTEVTAAGISDGFYGVTA